METEMVEPEMPDWVLQLLADEREKALEEAAKAVESEPFHVATQDQVDVLVAAKVRIVAAIRALKDTSCE
jgi:L-asparaginase II